MTSVGRESADPPAAAAPVEPVSSSPAPVPAPSPSAVVQKKRTFTCWNGRTVKSRKKCREPHGTRGVYWVFPLLDGQNCRPRMSDSTPGRRMLLECYFYGRQVRMDVSLWRDVSTGVANYSARLGEPTGAGGSAEKYAWDGRMAAGPPAPDGLSVDLARLQRRGLSPPGRCSAAVRKSGYASPVPDDRYYGPPTD